MGIKVLPPDVNESEADFAPRGTDIRFGLTAVRNVGANVVDSILATRAEHGPFASFTDFIDAVEPVACNKRTIESLIKSGAFDSLGESRKGLVSVHEQVIDIAVEDKRAKSAGQFDLFGDLGDDRAAVVGSLQVQIPAGEWDKRTLLAAEREMLGLYVSDHPLNGLDHVLRANSDLSIAELLESEKNNEMVTLAGLITGVQRKATKNTGEPWAIVTLEDLDASIEVMVFPKTYAPVGPRLVEDTVVVMRGRFDRREEESPRLSAQEITFPDLEAAESGPVRLSVDAGRLVAPVAAALKEILANHPGSTDVHLLVRSGERTTVLRLEDRFRVRPGPSLSADLKALLGAGCLG
jgi:DNA polymerase-3 subunit alpha